MSEGSICRGGTFRQGHWQIFKPDPIIHSRWPPKKPTLGEPADTLFVQYLQIAECRQLKRQPFLKNSAQRSVFRSSHPGTAWP